MRPELSIVVPCYNEEESLPLLYDAFTKLAPQLPSFEIVFVDDGSADNTIQIIRELGNKPNVPFSIRLVPLSRNFGHQRALLAGMQNALGDACVTIDADLQDPPEVIVEMVREWKKGFDVVLGQRNDRSSDSWFKRWSADKFYKIMSYLTRGQFPENVADFRLVNRRVLDVLASLKDTTPYWRGLVVWVGFKRTAVTYVRASRVVGETKYPFRKMVAFALDGIFAFSKEPLQISSIMGFIMSGASFFFAMIYIGMRLFGANLVPGWTGLLTAITLLGGIQLICLGIIGQYIGRIYEQVLSRPVVLTFPVETIHESRQFKNSNSMAFEHGQIRSDR